jgi:hypothetical protein
MGSMTIPHQDSRNVHMLASSVVAAAAAAVALSELSSGYHVT